MTLADFADRAAATVFMCGAALLLVMRVPSRWTRMGWIALVVLGAAYDVALNIQPINFPNSNFDHYYLGAKYAAPYADTYRLILAGQGRPQVGMRDLERPPAVVRSTTQEQRAYYIDLLRAAGAPFDPWAPLDTLATRARDSGAIEAEAEAILAARLPAHRIPDYRRDARAMLGLGQGAHVTLDYGYNGSPFYGLVRQADPTLHLPFGRLPALAGLAWQLLGVALIALLASASLGLTTVERLAVAALILASSEFSIYAMPGLVFTELWVPILLATWALRRGHHAWAGAAIAFAGLIKLFPFLLVLVAVMPLLRSFGPGAREPDAPRIRRRAVALLASCAATTLVLGLLSLVSGRTWPDFLAKISAEFASGARMINGVSAATAQVALGVPDRSPLLALVSAAALAPLALLFWRRDDGGDDTAVPRRALLLMMAMGWLANSWINYYAIVPFMLLPWLARVHRAAAVTITLAIAASYLLPDFIDPALAANAPLHVLKLTPYLVVPAWLVGRELREQGWGRRAGRVALVIGVVLALATAEEVWRGHEIQRLTATGEAALASGDASRALATYDRLVKLSLDDARTHRMRAIALASTGRLEEALPGFERAVSRAPRDAAARDDYGRALVMSGRFDEASRQLEAAVALTPSDAQILYQLARVRFEQGRRPESLALLARARELAPEDPTISETLEQLGGR